MPETVEKSEPDLQPTLDAGVHPQTADAQSQQTFDLPDNTKVTDQGGGGAKAAHTTSVPPKGLTDYEILHEIARGGMGVVYKARQKSLDRVVALKMILSDSHGNEVSTKRFQQEARAAAALDHPAIVPIYEINECDGKPYYTMAFIDGASLTARVRKRRFTPDEAVALLLPVVDAVALAHAHNIVHRDLKPDNILIDSQGRPRVTDFGLAKRTQVEEGLTLNGQILGTPSFMAPEQARGGHDGIGLEADIYAIGAILHYMMIGTAPFTGSSVTEILYKVLHDAPRLPRQINPDVPEALNSVIARCLQKDPAARYRTAADLAAALRGLAHVPNTIARAPDCPTVTETPAPRPTVAASRAVLWAALALAVLAVLAGGAYFLQRPGAGPAPAALAAVEAPKPRLFFPEAKHQDFGLKVQLLGGAVDDKGIHRFKDGDSMRIKVEVDKDCFVGIWSMDAEGQVIQLFPNDQEPNYAFVKGKPRVIPEGDIAFDAVPSSAAEQIRVVASTVQWDQAKGGRNGPYMIYRGPQVNEMENAVRSVRSVRIRAKVAEMSIPYFVTKAK